MKGRAMKVIDVVVAEVRMHVKRRRVYTEREHAESEHGDQAAAHKDESMSAATRRQRLCVFLRCRTNAANVSRLT